MPSQRPPSYAWALHPETSAIDEDALSEDAAYGLELAETLAWNRSERSQDPRRFYRPAQLTIPEVAARYQLSSTAAEQLISQARRELFGSLSDAAIAKRAQRLKQRTPRVCRHPRCTQEIPIAAHGNRHHCPQHSSPAARVQRHRQRQQRQKRRNL